LTLSQNGCVTGSATGDGFCGAVGPLTLAPSFVVSRRSSVVARQ